MRCQSMAYTKALGNGVCFRHSDLGLFVLGLQRFDVQLSTLKCIRNI